MIINFKSKQAQKTEVLANKTPHKNQKYKYIELNIII